MADVSVGAGRGGAPQAVDAVTRWWLWTLTALIVAIVFVGGVTRLTESGLSIVEWEVVTGVLPPLSEAAWEAALAEYRSTTEYQSVNRGMAMADFKVIYYWEWGHRLLGRIIGMVALVGWLGLWAAGRLPVWLRWAGGVIAVGVAFQGALGWWMVKSGLTGRIDVAPQRLAAHFSAALILLGLVIWAALSARRGMWIPLRQGWGAWAAALVLAQCVLGAFVAGARAGRTFTDWPLYAGAWLPPSFTAEGLSLAERLGSLDGLQFHHRMTAYALLALFAVWALRLTGPDRVMARWMLAATLGQAALGIFTLMHAAPLWLGAAHQLAAVGVWSLAVVWAFGGSARAAPAPALTARKPAAA